MFYRIAALSVLSVLFAACASTTPTPVDPDEGNTETVASADATQPDTNKLKNHLEAHVQYPASRSDVLAACANTPEFTTAEKRWTSNNLPEGEYQNADEVTEALRLTTAG